MHKQHSMQRIISLLAITTLLFAMLPLSSVRADGTGPWSNSQGTMEDPHVITTADQLYEVRNHANEHFVLGADIDLDVPAYKEGEGWEPIGWFNGTLDGQGFKIKGLYINRPNDENVGLFGILSGNAVIANVKLENVDVTGMYSVGGLAGWNYQGSINNSSVSGKVSGDESESFSVGGLVGFNEGDISNSYASSEVTGYSGIAGLAGESQGNITDSYASGNVVGVEYVGGLVGWNWSLSTIVNSHASGKVTGNDEVGGLVGRNSESISHSFASGEVEGESKVGGLAGINTKKISNSYANGTVTGNNKVGGLVGLVGENNSVASIENSYANGAVTGVTETGGFVGKVDSASVLVTNSFWDIQASGQDYSAAGEGKTTEQMQNRYTFADDWDLFETWSVGERRGYPFLRWASDIVGPPPWNGEGTGTENKPYLITTAEQLNEARNYLDAHFELGGNIDLSLAYGAGEGWEPIGTRADPFIGIMDGNGYRITGLYMNRTSQDEVGLFGVTGTEATISNIRLDQVDVTGNDYVGGLIGMNAGDVNNVFVSGVVTGSNFVGGLVGDHSGNINQSYASSKVEGANFLGGLVGTNVGDISNSYANGDINVSSAFAGGLVGSNDDGTIRNSYASGKVTGDHLVGGLVSENVDGTITASYWDKASTNQSTSAGSNDEYGKSTVEMKQQATYAGWDFDHIWAIDEGESYPYLQSDYEGAGSPWTGSGTEEDPYIIRTVAHLNEIRDYRNAHFKLGANINLDVLPYNTGEGWEPIGTFLRPFNGKLDGKGFKITGLYIKRTCNVDRDDPTVTEHDCEDIGLFAHTGTKSKISNLKLEDVTVTTPGYDLVGGLVGYNYGSISYSSVSGKVEAYSNAGSLVGYNAGNISYSSGSGVITGVDVLGGLAGANEGNITQSYASTRVDGVDGLGGLVGANDGRISNSYATGDVTPSNSYAGGLVGVNDGNISNSYANGKVEGYGYVGGLVSEVNGGRSINSYWDKETTTQTSSAGSTRSYGKSTAEMKRQATFADWDFESIWAIDEDEGYPYLKWVADANLGDLTLSEGTLSPVFTAETINYAAAVFSTANSVDITATTASGGASLTVNGTSAISGIATTVPLLLGRNTIDVVVTAYDGLKTKRYTLDIMNFGGYYYQPGTETIQVPVETGHIGSATTVLQTPITRVTEPGGRIRDEVRLTPDRARETAKLIEEAGQSTARIMIPDQADSVSRVDVNILREAIKELVAHIVSLEIYTENVRLLIPQRSIDAYEDDLYFHIIPLKEESQRKEVENRAKSERIVREAAENDRVRVVARPMTIETNMPNQPVTLILPLRDVQLPENAAERAKFLRELRVFIEHSDGEKSLVKGRIVAYKDGLLGIEFVVNKFSTFTILHMEDIAADFHDAYIRGYEDGTFKPNQSVTRAEIAAMVARNLGLDDSGKPAAALFRDVPASYWAAGAIEYVKQQGLMIGDATGAFNPNGAITRAEMAAIAARYRQITVGSEEESASAFTDTTGHWAMLEIAANKQAGIMIGYEDGTFRPNGNLTRAEAVKVINRMFDRGPLYEAGAPTFKDVNESHWAFYEVEEAARDHFFIPRFEGGKKIVE